MTSDMLLEALGDIGEDLVFESKGKHGAERKRFVGRSVRLVAAVAAALLAFVITAVAVSTAGEGDVAGWFDGRLQSLEGNGMTVAQFEVVGELTQELGISVTDAGYTVTAETVTIGRENLVLMMSVSPVQGTVYDDCGYVFDEVWLDTLVYEMDAVPSNQGISWQFFQVDASANKAYIVVEYTGYLPLEQLSEGGYTVPLRIDVLKIYDIDDIDEAEIVEGQWELEITLGSIDLPEIVTLPAQTAMIWSAGFFRVTKAEVYDISLSETDISYKYTKNNERLEGDLTAFVKVILKDGTIVSGGSGRGTRMGDVWCCTTDWITPVDLAEVDYIQFGRTKIPVEY